jgi:tricorn protease
MSPECGGRLDEPANWPRHTYAHPSGSRSLGSAPSTSFESGPRPALSEPSVDVRNDTRGFVNVYAIDVLARRGYLNMTLRGLETAPVRTVLGQRSLELPTILVTNPHSLSDADDFTEGCRRLGLGEIVGEPTAGWIIYTWGQGLVDGSTFRLAGMRIADRDGVLMEGSPRPVYVEVKRPLGESYTGRDVQLDTAVADL